MDFCGQLSYKLEQIFNPHRENTVIVQKIVTL